MDDQIIQAKEDEILEVELKSPRRAQSPPARTVGHGEQ